MLLKAQRIGEQMLGFWPDTVFARAVEGTNYVVRHPSSGDYYLTRPDKKGRSQLVRYHIDEKGRVKTKREKMGGMTVEHPTFTADGRVMIFASEGRGRGGYDLWFSLLEKGKWGKPVNLGDRINTEGDEITPSIYGDCLLFASNGQPESDGYLSLYSTRLVSERRMGDTAVVLQLGRCRVQLLPQELNDPDADDFDLVVDTAAGYGYWISNRDSSDTASLFFSFNGSLDGVQLWGQVLDLLQNRLENVRVVALQGGHQVCNTATDQDGFYHLYLQANQYYELSYQLDDYFINYEQVNTAKGSTEYLIGEARRDVEMSKLQLGQRLYFNDLFAARTAHPVPPRQPIHEGQHDPLQRPHRRRLVQQPPHSPAAAHAREPLLPPPPLVGRNPHRERMSGRMRQRHRRLTAHSGHRKIAKIHPPHHLPHLFYGLGI